MKTLSELTKYYYDNLYPSLEKLEKKRENIKFNMILSGFFVAAFNLILLAFLKEHIDFIVMGDIAVAVLLYKFFTKDYKNEFKEKIIKPLIKEIDENLVYLKNSHIQKHYFERSGIFTESPDKFTGDDYIRGSIDDVEIELSEVFAQKEEKNSKGESEWRTIFQGLFIMSEFNKNFKGNTVILPDHLQSALGDLVGNWLQARNLKRDMLVKMDSVEFEKEFVVYSTDQIEARYILSHSLMERLLAFKKRSAHKLSVSFIDSRIYLAIDYGKSMFEPTVFSSLLEYKTALEYIDTLHLSIGIVEELKLNERLWSKK